MGNTCCCSKEPITLKGTIKKHKKDKNQTVKIKPYIHQDVLETKDTTSASIRETDAPNLLPK
jgi:hypothetical protein